MRKRTNERQHFTAVLRKSGKQFVALCLELGIVGCGTTRPQALRSLQAALDSYLEYAGETGLPNTRPIAIRDLHEFLFYDSLAKPVKSRNGHAELTMLSYA